MHKRTIYSSLFPIRIPETIILHNKQIFLSTLTVCIPRVALKRGDCSKARSMGNDRLFEFKTDHRKRTAVYRVTFVKAGSAERRRMGRRKKKQREGNTEGSSNALRLSGKIIEKFECDFTRGYSPFENIREILRARSFFTFLFSRPPLPSFPKTFR